MVGDPVFDERERGEVEEREFVIRVFAVRRLLQTPKARQCSECLIELGRGRSWHKHSTPLCLQSVAQDVAIVSPMSSTPIEVPKPVSIEIFLGWGTARVRRSL